MAVQTSLLTWDGLVQSLKEAFSTDVVDIDHVNRLMSLYVSDEKDWERYSNFDNFK